MATVGGLSARVSILIVRIIATRVAGVKNTSENDILVYVARCDNVSFLITML